MADLVAQSTAPTVTFDDTSASGVDWRLRLHADDEFHMQRYNSGSSAWDTIAKFTDGQMLLNRKLTINSSAPTLVFDDSSGTTGFRLIADADTFSIQSGPTFPSVMDFGASGITARQNVSITGTTPTLTLDPTSGSADYSVSSDGTAFQIKRISGGSAVEVIGAKDTIAFAPGGIAAGHPSADGATQAFCAKRYSNVLTSTDVTNGNFTIQLADLNPAEWSAKTLGAIVMMSNTDTTSSVFQVGSWCAAAASGYFTVAVSFSSGVHGGDEVKVAFDSTFYGVGDRWRAIVFYEGP